MQYHCRLCGGYVNDAGICTRCRTGEINGNPSVRQIVLWYLHSHGFEGLYTQDCGCSIDDLFPCGGYCDNCVAGYKLTKEQASEAGIECEGDYVIVEQIPEGIDHPAAERTAFPAYEAMTAEELKKWYDDALNVAGFRFMNEPPNGEC